MWYRFFARAFLQICCTDMCVVLPTGAFKLCSCELTPCRLVGGHQSFRRARCKVPPRRHHYVQGHTVSQPTTTNQMTCVKYLLTYLLTPWCRVLPKQLTGLKLVKKFPAFHGTRRFITALKRPPPVPILGQPDPVHMPTSHLPEIHPNIIHPPTPRSPQWSPSLRVPTKTLFYAEGKIFAYYG